jgi:hypothetical protein
MGKGQSEMEDMDYELKVTEVCVVRNVDRPGLIVRRACEICC